MHLRHLAAALLFGVNTAVLVLVNRRVAEPYMDEIFHVPQTHEYCMGHFSHWDPKITTFPGLYLVSVAAAWANRAAQVAVEVLAGRAGIVEIPWDVACTATSLRWVNVALLVACFYLLHAILGDNARRLQHQKGTEHDRKHRARQLQAEDVNAVLYALVLCAFPLLWSYTFMYYTDVGSCLLLLLCHLLCLRQRFGAAAAAGAAAVLFRQTNAVWATFFLGASVLQKLNQLGGSRGGDREAKRGASSPATATTSLPSELGHTLRALQAHWRTVLGEIWPMLTIPFGFVTFLVTNGGAVVVGDRAAHAPACHVAQLLYFGAFACASLAPVLLPGRRALVQAVKLPQLVQITLFVSASALCAFVGLWYSLAHPYLLADNRHYTFYIWRRLLGRPRAWFYLAPAYAASWTLLSAVLWDVQRRVHGGSNRSGALLWLLGFLATLAVTLIPAHLLELRYFTPGLLVVALHVGAPSRPRLLALGALYCLMNSVTLYLYVYRPFRWPDGSVARFMW